MNATNYLGAGTFPWKLIRRASDAVQGGRVMPYHLQLYPTNSCNGACSYCCFRDVDRSLEMPTEEAVELLGYFARLGTRAVSITGGGEPTMHPGLREIIASGRRNNLSIAVVTNGITWGSPGADLTFEDSALTWVRVSVTEADLDSVCRIAERLPHVAVGASFIVHEDADLQAAAKLCLLADRVPNLTHVRFGQDVIELPHDRMAELRARCRGLTDKAIFQWRDNYESGVRSCLLSRLRPVIDPTGQVYACCSASYAGDTLRRMPESFAMGHWSRFAELEPFDGSRCVKCYYGGYNEVLHRLTTPMEHEAFV